MIFGLAAQQTLGNLIAGTVLLSARPFRVGERVRLQGGPLAGQIEGTVSSLGLLYTTFATGEDSIMVPNSVVLNVAVLPLREPEAVNLRARLRAGMTPGDLQEILEKSLQTPLRDAPRITLEELDGDEVVVLIAATPRVASQGRQLASELLGVVSRETRSQAPVRAHEHAVAQEQAASRSRSAPSSSSSTRRLELAAGEDAQRLAAALARRRRAAARASGTARPAGRPASSWQARCGPPSHSSAHTRSARAARRARLGGRAACRAARARSRRGAASAGRLAAEAVRITTRAAGSASSGMSGSSARRPETMHASGSSLSPRAPAQRAARGVAG